MSAQTITIISGVLLLAVFVLVGWSGRRRRGRRDEDEGSGKRKTP